MVSTLTAGPPRRLLLATDLSARSDRALDRASLLASQWHAALTIVHALEDQPGDDADLSAYRRRDAGAEARARKEILEANPAARVIIEKGDPSEVILRVAAAEGCDLIVIGVARHELLGRVFLGRTVDSLVRRAQVPVLVVRQRARRPYESIVVASDLSELSGQALGTAQSYFSATPMTLFHAYRPPMSGLVSDPEAYRREFRDRVSQEAQAFLSSRDGLAPAVSRPKVVLELGDPAQALRDYVDRAAVDLVVAGTHGRNLLVEALIGSVAKDLMTTLPCDTLLVRSASASVTGNVPDTKP